MAVKGTRCHPNRKIGSMSRRLQALSLGPTPTSFTRKSGFKVPSDHVHNTGVKPGQLDNSNEDESCLTPHTKPTILDTFSSTTSDCEPPVLYSHVLFHNDTRIKTDTGRLLYKYIYLSLYL